MFDECIAGMWLDSHAVRRVVECAHAGAVNQRADSQGVLENVGLPRAHTGDIGAIDDTGRLVIRGRKKEVIVTPEGLKVFPEDVERVLNAVAGVRESAVVGRDHPHAVLVVDSGTSPEEVIRLANQRLEDHQKVRGLSV